MWHERNESKIIPFMLLPIELDHIILLSYQLIRANSMESYLLRLAHKGDSHGSFNPL